MYRITNAWIDTNATCSSGKNHTGSHTGTGFKYNISTLKHQCIKDLKTKTKISGSFHYYKFWFLFLSKKTNHTTHSNQSNYKSCLLSLHQLMIPVWIKDQKYVLQTLYRSEYLKQSITIWIVSWPSVSLHPYKTPLMISQYWWWHQAITWTNVDQIFCQHMVRPGHHELNG